MTLTEGNKLIVEFLGAMVYDDLTCEYVKLPMPDWAKRIHNFDTLKVGGYGYHTSFDWLMPVVEKIEQDEKMATLMYVNSWDNRGKYSFSIFREWDESKNMRHRFIEVARSEKIKAVWEAVIEFILLYNENMIPRTEEDFNKNYLQYNRRKDKVQYGEPTSPIQSETEVSEG